MPSDLILDASINKEKLFREIASVFNKRFAPNIDTSRLQRSLPLGKIRGELGEFEKSLEASNARVVAFGASAGAVYLVERALKDTVKAAIEVEKSIADIATVMGRSFSGMEQFTNGLFRIANSTGQSFASAAKAAADLARQGLGLEDTLKRTNAALLLTRLSGRSVEESLTAITAAVNSFTNAAIDDIRLVNQMAAVDQKFAVSSGDLAEAIKRVGSTASEAGVSIEQLIALVTSAQHITSRGGAIIGNAFKSIFTRLERPKVLEQLEGIGVQVKNLDGTLKPVMSVLTELANRFDTLSQAQQSHIAELVGGVYQMNILKAALRDVGKEYSFYTKALETANNATDEAQRRSEQLNQTLSAQLQRTLNNLTKSGASLGEATFGPAIRKVLNSLEGVNDVGSKIGATFFAGIGKALAGPGLSAATLILLQLGKRMVTFVVDAITQVSGLTNHRKELATVEKTVTEYLKRDVDLMRGIADGSISIETAHKRILQLIRDETALMEGYKIVAKEVALALSALGARPDKNPPFINLPVKTKSAGHIPEMVERMGALAGGYTPGNVRTMTLEGRQVVYNDAERVVPIKKVLPWAQSNSAFIVPPRGSRAREDYDKKLKSKGISPEIFASGYVPNLAEERKNMLTNLNPSASDLDKTPYVRYLVGEPVLGTLSKGGKTATVHGLKPETYQLLTKSFKEEYEKMITNIATKIYQVTEIPKPFVLENLSSFGPTLGRVFEDTLHAILGTKDLGLSKDLLSSMSASNVDVVRKAFQGNPSLSKGVEFKASLAAAQDAFGGGQAERGELAELLVKRGIDSKKYNNDQRAAALAIFQEAGATPFQTLKTVELKDMIQKRSIVIKRAREAAKANSAAYGMIPNMARGGYLSAPWNQRGSYYSRQTRLAPMHYLQGAHHLPNRLNQKGVYYSHPSQMHAAEGSIPQAFGAFNKAVNKSKLYSFILKEADNFVLNSEFIKGRGGSRFDREYLISALTSKATGQKVHESDLRIINKTMGIHGSLFDVLSEAFEKKINVSELSQRINLGEFSHGMIPNLAKVSKLGKLKSMLEYENGSYVSYYMNKHSPNIDIDWIESTEKGYGFKMFKALSRTSRRTGKPITTGHLNRQIPNDKLSPDNSPFQNLLSVFPQLKYRQIPGLKNEGVLRYGDKTLNFNSIDEIEKFVNQNSHPEDSTRYAKTARASGLKSYFAYGHIPHLARKRNIAIYRDVGPEDDYDDILSDVKELGKFNKRTGRVLITTGAKHFRGTFLHEEFGHNLFEKLSKTKGFQEKLSQLKQTKAEFNLDEMGRIQKYFPYLQKPYGEMLKDAQNALVKLGYPRNRLNEEHTLHEAFAHEMGSSFLGGGPRRDAFYDLTKTLITPSMRKHIGNYVARGGIEKTQQELSARVLEDRKAGLKFFSNRAYGHIPNMAWPAFPDYSVGKIGGVEVRRTSMGISNTHFDQQITNEIENLVDLAKRVDDTKLRKQVTKIYGDEYGPSIFGQLSRAKAKNKLESLSQGTDAIRGHLKGFFGEQHVATLLKGSGMMNYVSKLGPMDEMDFTAHNAKEDQSAFFEVKNLKKIGKYKELQRKFASFSDKNAQLWLFGNDETHYYASGYTPELGEKVKDAMNREMAAGYNKSQVRLGFDSRIGPLVYNTTEGSARNAVNLHMSEGKSLSQIKKLGKARGHIPNLADEGAGLDVTTGIGLFASQLLLAQNGGYKQKELRAAQEAVDAAHANVEKAKQEGRARSQIILLENELEKLEGRKKSVADQQYSNEKRRNRALFAAFAIPAAGGVVESLTSKEFPRLGKAVGGLSEAASTAAQLIFAIPGPLGAAVGTAVGGLIGIGKVFHAFADQAPKLTKTLDEQKDSFEQASSALNNFSQTFEKLTDAYTNQTASTETINKLHERYAVTLAQVPEEYRALIQSATSAEEAQRAVGKALYERANKLSQLDVASSLAKRIDASRGVFANTSIFDTKTESGREAISTTASRVISSASNVQGFAQRISESNFNSPSSFVDVIKQARSANEIGSDIAEQLERLGNEANKFQGFASHASDNLNAFVKDLQKTATAVAEADRNLKITSATRAAQARLELGFKQATQDANDSIEALRDSMHSLASQGVAFGGARASLLNQARANLGNNQLSITEASIRELGSSMSDSLKTLLGNNINLARTQFEGASKFREANTDAINQIFQEVQSALEDVKNTAGETDAGGIVKDPARLEKTVNALQSLSNLRGKLVNASPEDTVEAIREFSRQNAEVLANKAEVVVDKNEQIIRQLIINRASLNQDFRQQLAATLANNRIAEQARDLIQSQKTLGGAEGFLNPGAYKEGVLKTLRGANILANPNFSPIKGKAAVDFLSGIKETFGFDLQGKGAVNLRELAIRERAKDISKTGESFANQLESFSLQAQPNSLEKLGLAQAAAEIRQQTAPNIAAKRARDQIETAVPLNQMPKDVARQVSLLTDIYNVLSGDIRNALRGGGAATDIVQGLTPTNVTGQLNEKRGLLSENQGRLKEISDAQQLTGKISALLNEEKIDQPNNNALQTNFNKLIEGGKFGEGLQALIATTKSPDRRARAREALSQFNSFGGERKVTEILQGNRTASERSATTLATLLHISQSGNSHSVHDHRANDTLKDILEEIKHGGSGAPTHGETNIQEGGFGKLAGRGGQLLGGAATLSSLALLLGTQRGRAFSVAGIRTVTQFGRSLLGRGENPNPAALFQEELGRQAGKISVASVFRSGGATGSNLARQLRRFGNAFDIRSEAGAGINLTTPSRFTGFSLPTIRRPQFTALRNFGGAISQEANQLVSPFVRFASTTRAGINEVGSQFGEALATDFGPLARRGVNLGKSLFALPRNIAAGAKDLGSSFAQSLSQDSGLAVLLQHEKEVAAFRAAQRATATGPVPIDFAKYTQFAPRNVGQLSLAFSGVPPTIRRAAPTFGLPEDFAPLGTRALKNTARTGVLGDAFQDALNQAVKARSISGQIGRGLGRGATTLGRGALGLGVTGLISAPFFAGGDQAFNEATKGGKVNPLLAALGIGSYTAGGAVTSLLTGGGVAAGAGAATAYLAPTLVAQNFLAGREINKQQAFGAALDNARPKNVGAAIAKKFNQLGGSPELQNQLVKGDNARRLIELVGKYNATLNENVGGVSGIQGRDIRDTTENQLRRTNLALLIEQSGKGAGLTNRETRSLLSGSTNNPAYRKLVGAQNAGSFDTLQKKRSEEIRNRIGASADEAEKNSRNRILGQYGLDEDSLQKLSKFGPTAGTFAKEAAFISLSRAKTAQPNGLSFEQGRALQYVSTDLFGSTNPNKENVQKILQDYETNRAAFKLNGSNLAQEVPQLAQIANVGGYNYPASEPSFTDRRQEELDKAGHMVAFNGRLLYSDNSPQAQFLRNLSPDAQQAYLRNSPTPQQFYRQSATTPEAALAIYQAEQLRNKNLLNETNIRPPEPGPTQAGRESSQNAEDLSNSLKATLGEFADKIGQSITDAITKGQKDGGIGGQLQVTLPTLNVNVDGEISIGNQNIGTQDVVVSRILAEIYNALANLNPQLFGSLRQPIKQNAGAQTNGR